MSYLLRTVKCSLCAILCTVVAIIFTSCGTGEKEIEREITWEKLPAEATVEIARTLDERKKGLMYREYLNTDSGMYFIMDDEKKHSFWMKNTRIPLTIAFIDSDNIIVDIKDMKPYDSKGVSSDKPVRYALEMDRGWFDDKGIYVGDKTVLKGDIVEFYTPSVVSE